MNSGLPRILECSIFPRDSRIFSVSLASHWLLRLASVFSRMFFDFSLLAAVVGAVALASEKRVYDWKECRQKRLPAIPNYSSTLRSLSLSSLIRWADFTAASISVWTNRDRALNCDCVRIQITSPRCTEILVHIRELSDIFLLKAIRIFVSFAIIRRTAPRRPSLDDAALPPPLVDDVVVGVVLHPSILTPLQLHILKVTTESSSGIFRLREEIYMKTKHMLIEHKI